jgi:pimeloyl-ACP methyl ester carboxylesterase
MQISVDADTFHADVAYLDMLYKRCLIGSIEMPLLDLGQGAPLVFVPTLESLEFVYARQIRFFSQTRRIILYRRHETRNHFTTLLERVEELRLLLNHLEIVTTDLIGHGDGAMILLEFALRYPQRCRSLTIVAQAAEHHLAPHPWVWLLHELYLRLPVERVLPDALLRELIVRAFVERQRDEQQKKPSRTVLARSLIEEQLQKIHGWPAVYKFSVLPITHRFNIQKHLQNLTMPVLLINRNDDALAPENRTRWLSRHLPNCAGYYVVPGGEHFFMYAEATCVNQIIQHFLHR